MWKLAVKLKDLNMGYKIAVAGATGNVGREMLEILAQRHFPEFWIGKIERPVYFSAMAPGL